MVKVLLIFLTLSIINNNSDKECVLESYTHPQAEAPGGSVGNWAQG